MKATGLVPFKSSRALLDSRDWDRDPFLWWRRGLSDFLNRIETTDEVNINPMVNATELDDRFEITAELPGLDESDIDLTVTGSSLNIRGEKKMEVEEEKGNYYLRERRQGAFLRTIRFPDDSIDSDGMIATLKNGVLHIVVPKREALQDISKKIEVKTQ